MYWKRAIALGVIGGLCAASLCGLARADNEGFPMNANPVGGNPDPNDPLQEPCNNADPNNPCCPTDAGHSVSLLTGNERYERTDLQIPGIYPIAFKRTYDGLSKYDGPLGYGWSNTYDLRLFRHKDNSVTVRGLCGMRTSYVVTGGAYQPANARLPGGPALSEGNGTFTLHDGSAPKARFACASDGRP